MYRIGSFHVMFASVVHVYAYIGEELKIACPIFSKAAISLKSE